MEEFRLHCERYFEGALEGKGPFRRRPSVSLRLVCDKSLATKLVACPCGTVRHGEFVPHTDTVYSELLQEYPRIVKGAEVDFPTKDEHRVHGYPARSYSTGDR